MPTTPYVAPKHGSRESPRSCFEPSIGLTSNTAVFNVTGHPAMSVPVGFAPAKEDPDVLLPVGMQIVGGLWQEKKMLRVGRAWESNFDWKETESGPSQAPISTNGRVQDVLSEGEEVEWIDVNVHANANGKQPLEVDITPREVAGVVAA
ncbi:Amidase [Apiospora phragmitis]|uniref:Amidase n=1 Tax=Apiospora phragmitis TaxID=2905665 RepID=A0ABR1TR58_9PEZI